MVVTATSGKLYGRVTLKGTRTLSQHLFNQRQIDLTGKKCNYTVFATLRNILKNIIDTFVAKKIVDIMVSLSYCGLLTTKERELKKYFINLLLMKIFNYNSSTVMYLKYFECWNRATICYGLIYLVGVEILDSAKTGFLRTSYSRRFSIRQSLCWLVFVEVYCLEQRRKYNANPSDKP